MGRKNSDAGIKRLFFGNLPKEVRDFFQVAEDGSFSLDSMLMEARRSS
jgi:hypothetical protein